MLSGIDPLLADPFTLAQSLPVEQVDSAVLAELAASLSFHEGFEVPFQPSDVANIATADADTLLGQQFQPVWDSVTGYIESFLQSADTEPLQSSLGESWSRANTEQVLQSVLDGSADLQIATLPSSVLQAKGAFSSDTQTIYLAEELLTGQDSALAVDVLLEELGHFTDTRINGDSFDTAGDEGAIFSALVQGKSLSAQALADLSAEDDHSHLTIGQQVIAVEQSSLENAVGSFVVGSGGKVEIDFLFDGGAYAGEVAVFSLAGMDNLGTAAFTKEAAKRALAGGAKGRIVISDLTEDPQYVGNLSKVVANKKNPARTKVLSLAAGEQFAFMLMPNGKIANVLAGRPGPRPLFSIAKFNYSGRIKFAQVAKGIISLEDLPAAQSDRDFNDLIFKVKGATLNIPSLSELIGSSKSELSSFTAKAFLSGTTSSIDQPDVDMKQTDAPVAKTPEKPKNDAPVAKTPEKPKNDAPVAKTPEKPKNDAPVAKTPEKPKNDAPVAKAPEKPENDTPSVSSSFVSSVSKNVAKFTPGSSQAEISATNAVKVALGTQTIYIGTQQVSSNNQNPIIRSFDSKNPANNWTRTDYEKTGADGRGLGLTWTGKNLYGVFSVDGTQGRPAEDFRRVSGDAKQGWLRSYGKGGGAKVSVLGRIDPKTGNLLDAAYLSAVLSSGKTNALTVSGIKLNSAGNLVVSAQSFYSPRRPDGSAMTRTGSGGSPFDYTVEITPDLSQVVKTSASGWR